MSSAQTRRIPVELGEAERTLVLDLNALDLIEEETGVSILQDQSILTKPSARQLKVLIWALLLHDEPSLNARKDEDGEWVPFAKDSRDRQRALSLVGGWCTIDRLAELGEAVKKSVEESMPDPDPKAAASARGNGRKP